MKKTITLLTILLSTTALHAKGGQIHKKHHKFREPIERPVQAPCADPILYNDGFYATLGAGFNSSEFDLKRFQRAAFVDDSTDAGLEGAQFHGGLGYGKLLNQKFYAGLKALFSFSTIDGTFKDQQNIGQQTIKLKQKHAFGGHINLGVPVGRILPYVALGVAYSKWELKSTSSTRPLTPSVKRSKNLFGYTGGVGADCAITKHFNVGFEYLYTMYRNIRVNHDVVLGNVKAKPNTSTINLMFKVKI